MESSYTPTTQVERAELLLACKTAILRPAVQLARRVLVDLDIAERILNWLEHHDVSIGMYWPDDSHYCKVRSFLGGSGGETYYGKTVREAIEKAMEAHGN